MKRLSPLLLLLPALAFATEVSPDNAARAAAAWADRGYAMGKLPTGRTVAAVDEIEDPATGARLLVAKFEGGGYVVLSADDLVDPVLAFSETGDGIDLDDRNPFWALLRGDIAAREAAAGIVRGEAAQATKRGQAKRAAATGDAEPTAAQRKWAALLAEGETNAESSHRRSMQGVPSISEVRVEPFIQSQWSQSSWNNTDVGDPCYNYYTPNNYVCGCVATAIAQIMRYWRFPTGSVTTNTYPCAVSGISVYKTMMGGVYAWDNMPLVPANGVTEAQRQEIGKLCYDVGVTLEMNWTAEYSSSSLYSGVACLPIDFGYANAKAVHYGSGQNYNLAHFMQGVVPNLDARCPVGVSVTGDAGHSIVADGYGYSDGDFYIHLNMGWAGIDDAWYNPPNIGTSHYAFNVIDGFLFNVFPTNTGSIASGRVLDASGMPVAGATVTLTSGSTTVDTVMTDGNGIYAFIAAPGNYLATAEKNGVSVAISVVIGETTGTRIDTQAGQRGRYYSGAETIGNSYTNDIALTGMAATPAPVFSPDSCLFYPSTNVTISCSDADATIRYTLDGSAPTETSTAYTGPILVNDTVTIKARSFAAGKNPSPVVVATYTYDAAQGAPKGDFFADPIPISGASGTRVIDDNFAYTVEDGEPLHTLSGGRYYYQYRTAWYCWTAPGSGTMTFRTSCLGGNTMYQTFIAVYTGDTLSSATRLAFATQPDGNYATPVSLSVEQGTTYRIVGMVGGQTETVGYDGAFTLQWSGDLTVARSPYETWADGKVAGGPEAVTGGVANAFRYVFNRPTGTFPVISSISFDASGYPVLTFPTFVNTNGVTLSVLSTANLSDWSSSAVREVPLAVDQTGSQTLDDATPTRFYRLKVIVE